MGNGAIAGAAVPRSPPGPDDARTAIRSPAQRALHGWRIAVVVLIAYGSLYPFQFAWPDSPAAALGRLIADSALWSSRGDVAGNLLLFLPWGALQPSRERRWHWPTFAIGLALALLLQLAQLGLPSRDAALSDVLWNGVGILLGQFLLSPGTRALAASGASLPPATVLLPLGWLLLQALPLVPTLDWQALKSHLRSLLGPSGVGLAELVVAFGSVLSVGASLLPRLAAGRSLALLALIIGLAAAARLLTVDNTLYRAELLSWALAWAAVLALTRTAPRALPALAFTTMLLGMTLAALQPFALASASGSFGLLPFAGYLHGDMLDNVRELAQTVWLTAALLWIGARMGGKPAGIGAFLVIWVLMLEAAQLWIEGRSADITPALTTLLTVIAMRRLHRADGTPAPRPLQPAGPPAAASPAPLPPSDARALGRALPLLAAAIVLGAAVFSLSWLIRQPAAPYNLRELFLANGHPVVIAIFVLALLWLGAGVWVALALAARTRRPWLALPGTLLLSALVSLLLLKASVTPESLMDVAGSDNTYWMVTHKLSWGPWWASVFQTYLSAGLVAPVEHAVRYAALHLPPAVFLAIALMAVGDAPLRLRRTELPKALALLLPLLWLCKAIAFDWSSTDNLNELIARDGAYGLGGGVYLYPLLALLALNMALVGQARRRRQLVCALAMTIVCVPATWLLLNQGLAPAVEKYGLSYSGAQFLLGPDRKVELSSLALQLRWAGLYLVLLAVGAGGIRLAHAAGSRFAPDRR